mgnify:CR=1 FL=1
MRWSGAVAVGVAGVLVLGGCGGNVVRLPGQAVDDLSRIFGKTVPQLEVPPGVIDDIALDVGVAAGQVRGVADDVAGRTAWDRVMSRTRSLQHPTLAQEDVAAVASDAACSAFREGRVLAWEDVVMAAVGHYGYEPEHQAVQGMAEAAGQILAEMDQAASEGAEARVAVLISCFALTSVPELE